MNKQCPSFELELSPFVRTQFQYDILSSKMILYYLDKGQNTIDKTKFHDSIVMKYCPGGHNFALHKQVLIIID